MAGLLDFIKTGTTGNPALDQGLLQAGLSLLQGRGNFGSNLGRAGMDALAGMQAAQNQQFQRTLQKNQLEEIQRKRVLEDLPGQFIKPAQVGFDATGGMETAVENPANYVPPQMDLQGLAQKYLGTPGGLQQGLALQQYLAPKPKKLTTVAPGATAIDEATGQPVYTAPPIPKEEDINSLIVKGPDGKPMINPLAIDARKQIAKAGASSVSVNTGQKGLDNTLKLRSDFRSEPIYKAHQEMQSAYSQIQQSLKQASPAGDLAGATKIMKLLDPGSVVRESELGMAMAASGLMDRVQNYASMILSGTKLTPTQRKDFQTLADALYKQSVGQYNAKRAEYEGIAKRNELSVEDVLGSEAVAPSGVVNFGDLK